MLKREDITNVQFHLFRVDHVLQYISFCDDFGPMNLGTVYQFCNIVETELQKRPCEDIGLFCSPHKRDLTNAAFLIGSYLIMKRDWDPASVEESFESIKNFFISYRDVSPGEQNFHLHLKDCWEGLWRAKVLGWANFEPGGFDLVCDSVLISVSKIVISAAFRRTNIPTMKIQ